MNLLKTLCKQNWKKNKFSQPNNSGNISKDVFFKTNFNQFDLSVTATSKVIFALFIEDVAEATILN